MKRSYINEKIKQGIAFLVDMGYFVPPFLYWSEADWKQKGHEYDEIRECMLGWDITDFGWGDFDNTGLLVITIRNGIHENDEYDKPYCEKALIVQDKQVTPMHFHHFKMEDIINRGGADLMIELYNADDNNELANTPVLARVDGRRYEVPAGSIRRLKPGESITLPPRMYHTFWAEGNMALIGEVSKVNDDNVDNHFLEAPGRFPSIEEDAPKKYLLFSEYPAAKQ